MWALKYWDDQTNDRTTGIGTDTKMSTGRYLYCCIVSVDTWYQYQSNPKSSWRFQPTEHHIGLLAVAGPVVSITLYIIASS